MGFTRSPENDWAGRGLRLAYSPENLRLGRALESFERAERIVVGTSPEEFLRSMRHPCIVDEASFVADRLAGDRRITYIAPGRTPGP